MNYILENTVAAFLKRHADQKRPILVGFSGGPDSTALLGILLKIRNEPNLYQLSIHLALAYVNHNWRAESGEEATKIGHLAKELGVPLHVKEIHPEQMEGNLEAACRLERLSFFKELCNRHGYQAVMLGHHADDLAETVLKRLFEGVSLPYLSGLQENVNINGLQIWRPLIPISKNEILEWLERHHLKAFEDCTNLDPCYLRGKFRTRIIPLLSNEFGKEIGSGLCRLAVESAELRTYLDQRVAPYLESIQEGSMGIFLDLSRKCPESVFEMKYLIRKLCERANFYLSRECLDYAARSIMDKSANHEVCAGGRIIFLDRGRLFINGFHFQELPPRLKLKKGMQFYGPWKVTLENAFGKLKSTGWKDAWEGKLEVILPEGDYFAGVADASMNKLWTNSKVPAFLRRRVPVLWDKTQVKHEFLTGNFVEENCEHGEQKLKITMQLELQK